MKKMAKEFKEFISRGNVMDMAIGIVIGGAFTTIINSLVNDILMPVIGLLFGGVDFTSLALGPVMIGNFIQSIVNFLLIALAMFSVIKAMNAFRKKKEAEPAPAAPAEPPEDIKLLREICEELKKK